MTSPLTSLQKMAITPSPADHRQSTQPLLTAEQFIRNNTDLIGIDAAVLPAQLTQRLQATPVHYSNILDGMALLRAFVSTLDHESIQHYALLLQGWAVTSLVQITPDVNSPADELPLWPADNRRLMSQVLEAGATKLLPATVFGWGDTYSSDTLPQIERVGDAYDDFDVELIDWLFLYPDSTGGYVLEALGEEALDDEVTPCDYQLYYVGFSAPTTH